MINYKLAKQLKEAGFPQKLGFGDRVYEWGQDLEKEHPFVFVNDTYFSYRNDGKDYKIPTLSELIEACGDEFDMLINIPETDKQKAEWEVLSRNDFGAVGKTPEEAVAKLWLKLNEQKKEI